MGLPASLESKCTAAVTRAAAYILGRQSSSGGFCFYQYGQVEEPSLGDTYYAVSALDLSGIEVRDSSRVAQFVSQARRFGLTYLYFYALTLDRLGLASRIGAAAFAQIGALTIALPDERRSVDHGGWLESARKTIRLQQRFGISGPEQARARSAVSDSSAPADRLLVVRDRYAHVAGFVRDLFIRSGFGVRVNLWDTYLALAVGSLLGIEPVPETASFVDSLQHPPFGFLMTPRSTMASLDVLYAGVQCCTLLGLPIRRKEDVVAFLLACQTAEGGFSHAPASLPNLEFTYCALRTLLTLAPELRRS